MNGRFVGGTLFTSLGPFPMALLSSLLFILLSINILNQQRRVCAYLISGDTSWSAHATNTLREQKPSERERHWRRTLSSRGGLKYLKFVVAFVSNTSTSAGCARKNFAIHSRHIAFCHSISPDASARLFACAHHTPTHRGDIILVPYLSLTLRELARCPNDDGANGARHDAAHMRPPALLIANGTRRLRSVALSET